MVGPRLVLCYVGQDRFAYFTSIPLADQWGDDWDDAPYEHNAGPPYPDRNVGGERIPHTILKLAWDGPYETPADMAGGNSIYSVEGINRGLIPWLTPSWWGGVKGKDRPIYGGQTVREFVIRMEESGGIVYFPRGLTIRGLPAVSPTRKVSP
ncbi:hypothetical protein EB061_05575 [bacterium]|nr:hypothetical protein [bacterium]